MHVRNKRASDNDIKLRQNRKLSKIGRFIINTIGYQLKTHRHSYYDIENQLLNYQRD